MRYYYRVFLFLALTLVFSCTESFLSSSKKPNPFLDRAKMAAILCDIQLAEAGLGLANYQGDTFVQANEDYYSFVFKKHGINEKEFKDNYTYYLHFPDQLDSVYSEMLIQLTEEQAQAAGEQAILDEHKRKRDSADAAMKQKRDQDSILLTHKKVQLPKKIKRALSKKPGKQNRV